jgi:uncharacterized protein
MLIEFTIKNYKSIKDQQAFSMVATSDDTHPTNVFHPEIKGMKNAKLLNTSVIFGANASGKSNLLEAIRFMRNFVVSISLDLKPNQKITYKPFQLDSSTENEPTEMEIVFAQKDVKYQYGFIHDAERIYEEWLYATPSTKPQTWFYRTYNEETNDYEYSFGSSLKGEKISLQEKTAPNKLFLSVASQFNHAQLLEVYKWFDDHLMSLGGLRTVDASFTKSGIFNNFLSKDIVNFYLKKADLWIDDFEIKPVQFEDISFPESVPDEFKEMVKNDIESGMISDLRFVHHQIDSNKKVLFSEEDESQGTRMFVALLGPLLDVLKNGFVICIDELAVHLHPLLVRTLIQLFSNEDLNTKNAQLIFTTHDTTLLDQSLFRRDQIWFTEKNRDAATVLYPLIDYKPRTSEALQKGYLAGRYGGIPILDMNVNVK